MQILDKSSNVYDAIIVGSGAGGGMATKILSEAGLKIAVVEAGPYFDPKDPETMTQLKWPWQSPRRGAGSNRAFGDFDMSWGDWKVDGEPYTTKDDTKFYWWRARMLGGRTNHWGRISLRFGPDDFKFHDIDGIGDNWPIGYEDIAPYYDRLDKMVGVFGSREGRRNDPDGYFLPAPKPRLHELYYIKGARKAGVDVIPARLSILTKKLNNDRGICFYCRQCGRSCSAYADFSASSVFVIPAVNGSGSVDLYTNAMVRSVTTDSEGRATGVSYIDKNDRREYELKGKTVVLGASACGSARILLNSKSRQHPNGLGNSSDVVGRYLHDSTGAGRSGFIPELMNRKTYNEDGVGGMHVYSPWWLDNKKLDFPRGYHIEIGGGMNMPGYGTGFNITERNEFLGIGSPGGYGDKLREDVKRYYGAFIGMAGRGVAIAHHDNYCEIDPEVVDQYGIPVLRFHYKWTDHERFQARHMHQTFEEIVHALGGTILGETPGPERDYGLAAPGEIIHEVGTTRMGNDPKTSVTNSNCQLHDADNVFVVDGGPFVSQGDKNCTWTIMALSMRTSEYIVDQIKKQNI